MGECIAEKYRGRGNRSMEIREKDDDDGMLRNNMRMDEHSDFVPLTR